MHHALEIQEILSNIFRHCRPPSWWAPASDLPALARTCRAFKEPALDVLWAELYSLSPVAQCLPDASHQLSPTNKYSFSRPLTQTEWDILRSHTRRIRVILNFGLGLDWDSVGTFLNPLTTGPLFPNLRHLCCGYCVTDAMSLLHLPLPSLISLDLVFLSNWNLHMFQGSLKSFRELAPNIRRLSLGVHELDVVFNNFFSSCICLWRNLQDVHCPRISLDADILVHLSRLSALTRLTITLSATLPDQIAPSGSPLTFPNLHHLELHSESLASVSSLLSWTRLPVITDLIASIDDRPSKQDVSSFLAIAQTSGISHIIQGLQLIQVYSSSDDGVSEDLELPLGFKDLQPCMAFSNLRRVDLDIECYVVLSISEALALRAACPHLKDLVINRKVIIGVPRTVLDARIFSPD